MSTKTPAPQTQQPLDDDPWRSGRARFGFNQMRRGRDRKLHFPGQQKDEDVKLVLRKHKIFLLLPALPAIAALIVLVLLLWASTRYPRFPVSWGWLQLIDGFVILVLVLWAAWRDGISWYLHTYIITNKRVIESKGLLEPTKKATTTDKIKQVGIDQETLWKLLLRWGTVHLYLQGGDMILDDVPNPKGVKEALDRIIDDIAAKKPKEEKAPTPDIPQVASVIDTLSKGKDLPKLEDADARYPDRHPERRLGPRRTFGGILRIPSDVRYVSGESTVRYIQRSRYVLYRNLFIPIIVLLALLPLAIYAPASGMVPGNIDGSWFLISGLVVIGLVIWMGLIYTNWVDDVYILSSKRIIDIDRRFIFLFETREEVEYKNIRDLKVKVHNFIERLLDIGDVYIELAGAPGVTLETVDHPFLIMDKIYEIQKFNEKVAEIKKENDQKKELRKWFDTVVSSLVDNSQRKGAPNLYNLELLEAMDRADALGFQVVVWDEEPAQAGQRPGLVVYQNPPPGTIITPGSEIQVVLSK